VAIGRIVARNYQAVQYAPTACAFITSPVISPELARFLRTAWGAGDPGSVVFDSLLIDFRTRGRFSADSPDDSGWTASGLQTRAACRLLYYFPSESAESVIARITSLDVVQTGTTFRDNMEFHERNGVVAADLIRAVRWYDSPEIKHALETIGKKTNDESIVNAIEGKH